MQGQRDLHKRPKKRHTHNNKEGSHLAGPPAGAGGRESGAEPPLNPARAPFPQSLVRPAARDGGRRPRRKQEPHSLPFPGAQGGTGQTPRSGHTSATQRGGRFARGGRPRRQVPARPAEAARRSPGLPHDVAVAAVAGAPRLAPEHVVVVPGVLALVEALGAQAHAGRDPARPAPVGHEVGRPHQAAQRGRVVGPHGLHEAVPRLPSRQQAAAPLQRLGRRLAAARACRRGQHPL